MPSTNRPGNFRHIHRNQSGCFKANVPTTSRSSPIKIEFWKGVGLVRYFRKRADNPVRILVANLLAPAIILASLARAILRKRRGA